jgi:hypothetical protein
VCAKKGLTLPSPSLPTLQPWGFENSQTPNHRALETMVSKISSFTGYDSRGPGLTYTDPASGATDDFAYGVLGAAGMTWEIGTSFHQNCQTFENSIVPDNTKALTYAAKLAHRPYSMAQGPDITRLSLEPPIISPGDSLKIVIAANNSALSNLPAASQEIREIRVYFDFHPFSTSDFSPYIVLDGSLTSPPDGEIKVSLNLNGIALGPHVVYAQAINTDGYLGPVAAVALDVESAPSAAPSSPPSSSHSSEPSPEPSRPPTAIPSSSLSPSSKPSVLPSSVQSKQPTLSLAPSSTDSPTECADSGSPICAQVARGRSNMFCNVISIATMCPLTCGWCDRQ